MSEKIYSFIGLARKAGALALGEELTERVVKSRKAYLVIVTQDAADNTLKKIETALFGSETPMIRFGNKENLGKVLGKELISVIGVTNKQFSDRINVMIEQTNNYNTAHGGGFN